MHYNSLSTSKTPKYQPKRLQKVPRSLAMSARICTLQFSSSLADLKPLFSTQFSVVCSCSNYILVGTNLGSYTIFHIFFSFTRCPVSGSAAECRPTFVVNTQYFVRCHSGLPRHLWHTEDSPGFAWPLLLSFSWIDKVWARHPNLMPHFFPLSHWAPLTLCQHLGTNDLKFGY